MITSDIYSQLSEKQARAMEAMKEKYPHGAVEWREGEAYFVVELDRKTMEMNLQTEAVRLSGHRFNARCA